MEPVRGQICAPALLRYHKMIDCMIRCAQQWSYLYYDTQIGMMVAGGCKCSTFCTFGMCRCAAGHMHLLPSKHCRK